MALKATYGNSQAFNIKVYDMAGGGYYAILCDGSTQIFQRRNSSGNTDTNLSAGGQTNWVLDRFLNYSFDPLTKILTLYGSVDVFNGVTFTRKETYRFVSAYVVENTWSVTVNAAGGINFTNWNYYLSAINSVWDINNTNFGDGQSFNPLGMGIQFTSNGPVYGCTGDSGYGTLNSNRKRALASQSAIASLWIQPGDGVLSLAAGQTANFTQWFFKSTNTLYDFMLQAQLAMSFARGYNTYPTLWEQICRVTRDINTGLMDNLKDLKVEPSFHYGGATYSRDSFWPSFITNDSFEQAIINLFSTKQSGTGQIPTYINGNLSTNFNQDESTLIYIIRCYYDSQIRGLIINKTILQSCLTYIRSHVVNSQYRVDATDGAAFKSWFDGYTFTVGSYNGYNQGLYCVALKCAQLLGLGVLDTEVAGAIAQYQALYDPVNKCFKFTSDQTYISTDVFVGEALSLFLFKQGFLTDQIVGNHIDKMRAVAQTAAGIKCMCALDGSYITFAGNGAGDYQAGGSWFLYEFLMYYAGVYHNYSGASTLINNRIAIELAVDPVSHEYLNTNPLSGIFGSESADRHAYDWNIVTPAFVLPPAYPFATKPNELFS